MQGHPDWRSAVAVTCSFIIILVAVVWTARKTSYKRKESRTNETEESEESEKVEKNVNRENDNANHENVKKNDDKKDPSNDDDETIPELSNPNWVKVGQIQELYMYPLKSGRGKTLRECDFTQYGISLEDKGRFTLRDSVQRGNWPIPDREAIPNLDPDKFIGCGRDQGEAGGRRDAQRDFRGSKFNGECF